MPHLSSGVSPIIDFEPQQVAAVRSALPHGDHARVLVQPEAHVFVRVPVEHLVWDVPVVPVLHMHSAYQRVGHLPLQAIMFGETVFIK